MFVEGFADIEMIYYIYIHHTASLHVQSEQLRITIVYNLWPSDYNTITLIIHLYY